ncbi:MAG TPA: VOC family protein [Candidatus Alistipes excrementavium]|nr:VOC family protein [Candidatus Alistipes excrementavium]
MKITHIALWTEHPEELREFYGTYFGGRSGGKYVNPAKRFESYQLAFDGECRLELMRRSDINGEVQEERIGLAHFAFACADREAVVALTERLRADGYQIVGEPRTTGDGYFESVVADPDGNLVEITC